LRGETTVNFTGLALGLFMLFAIGFGFLWVVKLEYYLGAQVWKGILALGLLICMASLFMPSFAVSAIVGIFGGSVVWGATELPGQKERVQRGLYPANPGRARQEAMK
jgi:hypothetical protein